METQTTRDRILEAAEDIMLEKSFHSVGLKQILESAKVPKGSFYHYFKSKEQFGVELLRHYMDEVTLNKRQLFAPNKKEDPLAALFSGLESSIEFFQTSPDRFPCLALKLASEVSDLSDPMRRELEKGFRDWIRIYQELFEEARLQGLLPATFESEQEAQLIHDLMTGATHRAVINRNPTPVKNAVEHIISRIDSMKLQ